MRGHRKPLFRRNGIFRGCVGWGVVVRCWGKRLGAAYSCRACLSVYVVPGVGFLLRCGDFISRYLVLRFFLWGLGSRKADVNSQVRDDFPTGRGGLGNVVSIKSRLLTPSVFISLFFLLFPAPFLQPSLSPYASSLVLFIRTPSSLHHQRSRLILVLREM